MVLDFEYQVARVYEVYDNHKKVQYLLCSGGGPVLCGGLCRCVLAELAQHWSFSRYVLPAGASRVVPWSPWTSGNLRFPGSRPPTGRQQDN